MEPYIVKRVDFGFTKLIDANNTFHQRIPIGVAKDMANQVNMDLVCFNNPAGQEMALCKIVDYGKWKFNTEKQRKKQQMQSKVETKEIRFTPDIADNDVEHKMRSALSFLEDGHNVVLSMRLRGRQALHFDEAQKRMEFIMSKCNDVASIVSKNQDKFNITIKICRKATKI